MTGSPLVALTGATGFLGRHLVVALAGQGLQIRLLSRGSALPPEWRGLSLDIQSGSLEEPAALERLAQDADIVLHVAGLIKARDQAGFLRVNRDGARAMAEATRSQAPRARFILVSSLAAREPQLSAYAASKKQGEEAVRAVFADAPDRLTVIRPPALYGPWDRETLALFEAAARAVMPIFGHGRAALCHVADAAAALARLALTPAISGQFVLSDSNPAGYRMEEILREAAHALGSTPRFLRLPDALLLAAGRATDLWALASGRPTLFGAGKAREILHSDWSVTDAELPPSPIHHPTSDLRQGFRSTVAWYRAAGWLR